MENVKKPNGLASIIYGLTRTTDLMVDLRSAVRSIALGDVACSPRKLVRHIDRMRELSLVDYRVYEPTAELISYAIRNVPQINVEQLVSWVDWLSERERDEDVARCMENFSRRNIVIDSKRVLKWAKRSMWNFRSYKPAALILIRGKCTKSDTLSTELACKWLLQSVENYTGDHGVARFLYIVTIRMKYMRPGSPAHVRTIHCIAEALFHIRNDSAFGILIERTRAHSRPDDWSEIALHLSLLLFEESVQHSEYRFTQISSLSSPKPNV